ncbi:MAG: fatty acid desaturase [Candidatus Obscuribacterales bacterium]|nr:fatty acid desaturase [Candidatus Obscuribacterales bacterium]
MLSFAIAFVGFYIWHALGVTVGYHRLISHRSFSCPKFVEYFWVMAGYLAFEGSPIWWATIHRAHHKYTDTALDPHSPRYGLQKAHNGWIKRRKYEDHIDPQTQSKDLVEDPLYKFLDRGGDWGKAHKTAFSIGILFRVVLLVMFGWQIALASILAGFAVLQIPLMLNVVCHIPKLGYKTYATDDDSVNVWWVAVLAMGEGWHNNHHASPGSAKTGMRFFEIDMAWLTIVIMKQIGLVTRVNAATHEQLMRLAKRPVPQVVAVPVIARKHHPVVMGRSKSPSLSR